MSFTKFKVQLGHPNEALDCEKTTHQEFKCSEQLHHHPSLAYLTTGRKESPTYKISNAAIVPSSETDTNPAATYLKALSQTLLRIVIIDKDISNPLLKKHMSPKFSAKQDDQENSKDLSEHLSIWAEAIKSMPDYQYEIIESVAEIHESGKKADVWTFKRLSGVPVLAAPAKRGRKRQVDNGVCKESVGVSMHSLGAMGAQQGTGLAVCSNEDDEWRFWSSMKTGIGRIEAEAFHTFAVLPQCSGGTLASNL